MPNRKAVALFSLHLLLAATASAGVVDPSKRAAIAANVLDSPSQIQQNQPDKLISEHDLSQIYRHVLVPRNTGETNERPDEPSREDNTEDAEEQLEESVPPGLMPPIRPGSRFSPQPPSLSESPIAVPSGPNGIEFANGQYIPSGTMDNEGGTTRTVFLTKFDVAILYRDYVDRLDFTVYSPEENVFYHCTGGLFTGNSISTPPNFTPCSKEVSEGVNDRDQGSIAFAVQSVRVPAPLTQAYPLVIYIQYANEPSWIAPISLDDSNVVLVSHKEEAQQYRYRINQATAFRPLGYAAGNN